MNKLLLLSMGLLLWSSCDSPRKEVIRDSKEAKTEAQEFINEYTDRFLTLYYDLSKAEWESNTHIVVGDTTNAYRTQQANEAYASYVGSETVIETTRSLLEQQHNLSPIQIKQLETILYTAANSPAIVEETVKKRIKAETAQTEKFFGYDFKINGQPVSTNEIDQILKNENDLSKRLQAWEESKEVGITLKDGLEELRALRNETVQALGYNDYFTYQVSDYGMSTEEMMDLNKKLIEEVWPLYREIHT